MDYDVDLDDKNRIVLCNCKGVLDFHSAKSMTRDVRKRAFEPGYGLLYDVTNVSLNVGLGEAYFFPRDIEAVYEDPVHRFGRAATGCGA
jgi:hypothetical protein